MIDKVVFMCGAGHSGSTLLGLVLGSHSQGHYLGEAKKSKYLYDLDKPERKRYCKVCGPDCKLWKPFHELKNSGLSLYQRFDKIVDSGFLVDSSKGTEWIQSHIDLASAEKRIPYLIYLKRDGRAVLNSRIRKYPDIEAKNHIENWLEQIEKSDELYNNFKGKKQVLLYHELTADPALEVSKICEFLDIPYEPGMLEFYEYEHHPLGGNEGTQSLLSSVKAKGELETKLSSSKQSYLEHPQAIKHDSKWKTQLSEDAKNLFDKMVGTLNTSFEEP